jgi:threonylcarbamoyladenosine tRNA methylthiotransferase MtaB
MQTVFIKTLGCKVNSFDSSVLHKQFQERGYQVSDSADGADIIVVNTCSVTLNAEKEARYLLRRFGREIPKALKVVTGCYAQTAAEIIAEVKEVDLVVPNEAKEKLIDYIEAHQRGNPDPSKLPHLLEPEQRKKELQFKTSHTFFDTPIVERVRAFLKIQDGCDGFCAYCQIPYARGASRSVAPAQVVKAAREIVASGISEITLTGIHIGDYGQERGERSAIVPVLEQLFAIPGLRRLRISSLEPSEVSPELLAVLADNREIFCDHFHLPLQAGSNRLLKSMGRAYDCAGYFQITETILRHFPQAQLTADVIPGFPGETAEDFAETIEFIKKCKLSQLHVFPYSKRPHTRALRFPDHLGPELIKERSAVLRNLSRQQAERYARQFIGRSLPILWESFDEKSGRFSGKTKNYLSVMSPVKAELQIGKITMGEIKGFLGEGTLLAVI